METLIFDNNKANNHGGGIYLYNDDIEESEVILTKSTFTRSKSKENGACIFISKYNCKSCTVFDNYFYDNHADEEGNIKI